MFSPLLHVLAVIACSRHHHCMFFAVILSAAKDPCILPLPLPLLFLLSS